MKQASVFLYALAICFSFCVSTDAGTEVFATDVDIAGTDLRWKIYVPTSGGPKFPGAVVSHAGGYSTGDAGPTNVAQDLASAGYLAAAAEYREAPPHTSMTNAGPPGQGQQDPPSDGRPPQQTDDVRAAIRALRADSRCNGKVVVIGFSAGGAHGAWWAIAGTTNDDKPDAFVGCSGVYDDDNSDLLANTQNRGNVENYINHLLTEGTPFHTAAKAASPYWLTVTGTPAPALLFNSDNEQIPQSVYSNMVTKFTGAGGTIESHLRTGTEHAGAYWYLGYGGSFSSVKDCTIDFLNRMLSMQPSQPVVPPQVLLRN